MLVAMRGLAGEHFVSLAAWPAIHIGTLAHALRWLAPWLGVLAVSTGLALVAQRPLEAKFDQLATTDAETRQTAELPGACRVVIDGRKDPALIPGYEFLLNHCLTTTPVGYDRTP